MHNGTHCPDCGSPVKDGKCVECGYTMKKLPPLGKKKKKFKKIPKGAKAEIAARKLKKK